ncbi:MAG: NTP transferase domain-containing protein [Acidimicrobiaceae bacterium]|nr:NTP transferase domain-containing protein [Acidimicrobiaceae bacterium]
MGRDKALVPVHGAPMVMHVVSALRSAGCDPVQAIGGDAPALAALGLDVVGDGHPGEGPLGGVITALAASADSTASARSAVAACVRASSSRSMASTRSTSPAARWPGCGGRPWSAGGQPS